MGAETVWSNGTVTSVLESEGDPTVKQWQLGEKCTGSGTIADFLLFILENGS